MFGKVINSPKVGCRIDLRRLKLDRGAYNATFEAAMVYGDFIQGRLPCLAE